MPESFPPAFLELYNQFDLDGNGYLDREEFYNFMETYYTKKRWTVSQTAMDQAFDILDKNKDNTVSKKELFKYVNLLFEGAF